MRLTTITTTTTTTTTNSTSHLIVMSHALFKLHNTFHTKFCVFQSVILAQKGISQNQVDITGMENMN